MSRLLIVAVLLLSGCATEKRCTKKFPPRQRMDSIYVYKEVISYKVDTVYVELPPLYLERYVSIKDTLKLTGSYSKAQSWVRDGNILGWLKEGEKPVKIEYKKEYVDRVEYKKVYKETIKEVKYLPKWAKIFIVIGIITCIWTVINVYLRFR